MADSAENQQPEQGIFFFWCVIICYFQQPEQYV
jgi:hypothetical protein